MPLFEYTARNLKGDIVKDQVDLPTKDDVVAHLRKNRLVPVDFWINSRAYTDKAARAPAFAELPPRFRNHELCVKPLIHHFR